MYKYPRKQIILTTYNQNFATMWGRRVKELVQYYGKDIGVAMKKSVFAANNFQLTNDSGMICIGTGGSLTGRGADLLIIDDPIKNDAEAGSITYRDAI